MENIPSSIEVRLTKHWTDYLRGGLLFLVLLFFILSGFFGATSSQAPELQDEYFNEQFLPRPLDELPPDAAKIGLLYLTGVIVSDSKSFESYLPGELLITPSRVQLAFDDLIRAHPDLKAFVLMISSPGGEVAASDEIANLIKRINHNTPVFVYTPDILASGGYYIAANAKKIYAHRQAEVGSLGVIIQLPNIKELGKKVGFELEVYRTGALKDFGNPFRERSEEEKIMIQRIIQKALLDFQSVVQEGRGLSREKVQTLSTGEIWIGKEAVENGLVDKALFQSDLSAELAKELGAPSVLYVQVLSPPTFLDQVLGGFRVKTEPLLSRVSEVFPFLKKGVYYYWY